MSDMNWEPIFQLLEQSDRTRIYEQFLAIFDTQLTERADPPDLRHIAHRTYVDAAVHRLETETEELLRDSIAPRFSAIRAELPDLTASVTQIHHQFTNQAELIKTDLLNIRESLATEHIRLQRAKSPIGIQSGETVPRGIWPGETKRPVYRPSRKKRVPPLSPVVDDMGVTGSLVDLASFGL
jgi:hypothetical protein